MLVEQVLNTSFIKNVIQINKKYPTIWPAAVNQTWAETRRRKVVLHKAERFGFTRRGDCCTFETLGRDVRKHLSRSGLLRGSRQPQSATLVIWRVSSSEISPPPGSRRLPGPPPLTHTLVLLRASPPPLTLAHASTWAEARHTRKRWGDAALHRLPSLRERTELSQSPGLKGWQHELQQPLQTWQWKPI